MTEQEEYQINQEILNEEKIRFKNTIRDYNKETPYYVYALCDPFGRPFYIGKGKGLRAWDHLKQTNSSNKRKIKTISNIRESIEEPIVFIMDGNLSEEEALRIEKEYIKEYGRLVLDENGILTNITINSPKTKKEISSLGGKIGGRTTKDLGRGIFSESYDRSAVVKKLWVDGHYDHIDFSEIGSNAGKACRDAKSGIHREDLKHLRSEWAKIGAEAYAYMSPNFTALAGELRAILRKDSEKMNANELADLLEFGAYPIGTREEAATTLRQQQAEIEKLRSWVEMLVEVPFFEEIDHYRGIPIAILRKAQGK